MNATYVQPNFTKTSDARKQANVFTLIISDLLITFLNSTNIEGEAELKKAR